VKQQSLILEEEFILKSIKNNFLKSYILFVFADFDDAEDVLFFFNDILSDIEIISDLRYIIQNHKNIIVIFSSESSMQEIDDNFKFLATIEQITYYIMFKLENVVSFVLPETIKNIIFKPVKNNPIEKNEEKKFDLDEILEKISKHGLNSISKEEKKFLDEFGF